MEHSQDVRLVEEDLKIFLDDEEENAVSNNRRLVKKDIITEQDALYNQIMVSSGVRLQTPVLDNGDRKRVADAGKHNAR